VACAAYYAYDAYDAGNLPKYAYIYKKRAHIKGGKYKATH